VRNSFLVVEGEFPPPARANLRLYRLGIVLGKEGVRANLLTPSDIPRPFKTFTYDGIRVRRFPGLARLLYSRARIIVRAMHVAVSSLYLTRLCSKNRRSTIHCWNVVAGLAGIVAGAITKTPVFVDFTDLYSDIARYESPVMARLIVEVEKIVARRANKVIAVTDRMRSVLISMGVEASRTIVIPDGTDEKMFRPGIDGSQIRSQYELGNSPVLIFHGDIKYSDGFDILLPAFREALEKIPSAKLLVVGGGPEVPRLSQLVQEWKMSSAVIFTGWVPHSQVPEYIAAADIGVMPLRSTLQTNCYLSFKLFEYWSMGKPVVVSGVDSISIVARNNESAVVVRPDDVRSLSDALTKALEDPKSLKYMGENGRKLVETTYNWDRLMGQESNLYKGIGKRIC